VDFLEEEKRRLTEQHSHELKTLEHAAEEKQKQLMETHRSTVQDLTHRHEDDLTAAKEKAKDELTTLQRVVCPVCIYNKQVANVIW